MTTVGDSLARLEIPADAIGEVVLVRIKDGAWENYRPDEISDKPLTSTLYIASGAYAEGTITKFKGRTKEAVHRLLWLPFDCDLTDYLGLPKETIWAMPQGELDAAIADQRVTVEAAFAEVGLPIHRLDYTGYGLCAYVYLPTHQKNAVSILQQRHKAIIARINRVAGMPLVDTSASDTGSRVTRVPGCPNTKAPIVRLSQTLYQHITPITDDQLKTAAEIGLLPQAMGYAVPRSGTSLPEELAQQIVDVMRPRWTSPDRHLLALGLAGRLGKAGVPEEQALAIVVACADGDEELNDRIKAVGTSYDKVRSGQVVAGYTSLAKVLTATELEWLDASLQRWSGSGVRIVVGGTREKTTGSVVEAKTADAFDFPIVPQAACYGWTGEYVDLVEPTTESPVAFHLACGLTLVGCMVGRKVNLYHNSDRIYPNFFTLLIGASGNARKDTAIRRSLLLPQLRDMDDPDDRRKVRLPPFRVARDISSAEGLIQKLVEDNQLYLYISEFAKLIHNATRESTTSIMPTLMDAFDNPFALEVNTRNKPLEATNPSLTIIAAVQPDILSRLVTADQEQSGFLNRWLLVAGKGVGPRSSPPDLDEKRARDLYVRARTAIEGYAENESLRWSSNALPKWNEWYDATYDQGDTPTERSMSQRMGTIVKKVALVHAVLDRSNTVDVPHFDAATALVEWSWSITKQLIPTWGEFPEARLQRLILEVLRRKGTLSRRKTQQSIGHRLGPGTFARVVKAMIENGELIAHPDGSISAAPEEDARV